MSETPQESLLDRIEKLNEIGTALSQEKNTTRLLEKILIGAKTLTRSCAGTIYILKDHELHFHTLRNDVLNLALGGTTPNPITFPPVRLYNKDSTENLSNVVSYAVIKDITVNIEDAYHEEGFDFSGTKKIDKETGYRSKSFLTIPLRNHIDETIGCLQLINRIKDDGSDDIEAFTEADVRLAESLASQAAVALTNQRLIDEQKQLFEDFIQLIAQAIDEKSEYTGQHCTKVPILSLMLADALNAATEGAFKDTQFTEDEYYELKIAAWLHDCGKVATPEHIMDKSTKLETIYDRIHHVDMRFEQVKLANEVKELRNLLEKHDINTGEVDHKVKAFSHTIDDDQAFIRKANIGGEYVSIEDKKRIQSIADNYTWQTEDIPKAQLLFDDEVENLQISRGTLNKAERQIINDHVSITLRMLNALHYPKQLERVPEIAGCHHEHIDGSGYPRQLTGDEMLLQAKIVAIADVFEALTAADRPYKPAKTLTESLTILGNMAEKNHVDKDLFKLFIREKVYLKYAKEYLQEKQIDNVDLDSLPGYTDSY